MYFLVFHILNLQGAQKVFIGSQEESLKEIVVHIVTLKEELDNFSISEFQSFFDKIIEKGAKYVVIDASELKYISSIGIASLAHYKREFLELGGDLHIVHFNKSLYKTVEIIGFSKILSFYKDTKKAMESFLMDKTHSSDLENCVGN